MKTYLDSYNSKKEEVEKNSNLIIEHTKNKHLQEEEEAIEKFNKKYPSQPKFSSDVLNMQKQMEEHIKKKDYESANELKLKIIEKCSAQDSKWKNETYKAKLKSEIDKLRKRQENELTKLNLKIKLTFDEMNIAHEKRILFYEQKYKNKQKDMINDHVTSKNSFNKPSKHNLIKKIGNNTFSSSA